jgi:hypothetical protein
VIDAHQGEHVLGKLATSHSAMPVQYLRGLVSRI